MIKGFLQSSQNQSNLMGENQKLSKGRGWRLMDQTQLSLGPHASILSQKTHSLSSESDGNVGRKRKQICHEVSSPTSIELQLNDPLPLEWEQCLDLQVNTHSLSLSPPTYILFVILLHTINTSYCVSRQYL